jgi:hypothetical protein
MQIRPSAKTDYPGKDLEAMSFAENYHQWILRIPTVYWEICRRSRGGVR